jgi:hypothetical protein
VAVSGVLLEYAADPATHEFSCSWKEVPGIRSPSRIYIPKQFYIGKDNVKLEPRGKGFEVIPAGEKSENVYLVVQPTGKSVVRHLTLGGSH